MRRAWLAAFCLLLVLLGVQALVRVRPLSCRSPTGTSRLWGGAEDKDAFDARKAEQTPVSKGLTHIKQNLYAPPPELAAKMTQEEFRAYIYKEMKRAESKRRSEQGGAVGSQISDDYINSLSKPKAT